MHTHEIVGQVRNGSRRTEHIGKSTAAKPDPQENSRKRAAADTAGAPESTPRKGPRYGCGF